MTIRYLEGPRIDWLLARKPATGNAVWYLEDLLGSIRLLVDATNGAILNQLTYDSFGIILTETNPANGDRFVFAGQERESLSALNFSWHRWHDPGIGRWISEDWLGFGAGDANLYRYVNNAPNLYVDPTGQAIWFPIIAILALGALGGFPSAAQLPGPQDGYFPPPAYDPAGAAVFMTAGLIIVGGSEAIISGVPAAGSKMFYYFRGKIGYAGTALKAAQDKIVGLYGSTTRALLEKLASSGGPTINVTTRLSGAPHAARSLHVAAGENAGKLIQALPNPQATKIFQGSIPRALIEKLKKVGLAIERKVEMGGVVGVEIEFLPGAVEFIIPFLSI